MCWRSYHLLSNMSLPVRCSLVVPSRRQYPETCAHTRKESPKLDAQCCTPDALHNKHTQISLHCLLFVCRPDFCKPDDDNQDDDNATKTSYFPVIDTSSLKKAAQAVADTVLGFPTSVENMFTVCFRAHISHIRARSTASPDMHA
jgi:hypothetical protein